MRARHAAALGLLLVACIDAEALGLGSPPAAAETGAATTSSGDDGGPATTGPDDGADSGSGGGGAGSMPTAAELYAQARCDALAGCECPVMTFDSDAQCRTAMEQLFLAQQERFATGIFDFDCFDAIIAFYDASTCETLAQIADGALSPACALFTDDDGLDESCERASFTSFHADSCSDGSSCVPTIDGPRCRPEGDDSQLIAAGEPCVGDAGIAGPCESGTWCDFQGSQVCLGKVDVGMPCTANAGCLTGWCDPSGAPAVCTDKLDPGSACTSTVQCALDCGDGGPCERALCAAGECQQGVPQTCFTEDM